MSIKVKVETTLSDREEAFLGKLACGLRPSPAAVAAGYSIANGRHLIHRRHMAMAIRHAAANLASVVRAIDAKAVTE